MDLDKVREQKFDFVRMLLINACVCGKFRFIIGTETFLTTKPPAKEHNAVVQTVNLLDGQFDKLQALANDYGFKVTKSMNKKDLIFESVRMK